MLRELRLVPQVLRHLGLQWVLFRSWYAVAQKTGWQELGMPAGEWTDRPLQAWLRSGVPSGPEAYAAFRQKSETSFFFSGPVSSLGIHSEAAVEEAENLLLGLWRYFGGPALQVGFPPDWHLNPRTGLCAPKHWHWSRIREEACGDIKLIWEPSRFGCAFLLARAYAASGDERYPFAFWMLVEDWARNNRPMRGPNWRCGQEVAFRILAWCFGLRAFAASVHSTPARVASLAAMLAWQAERIEGNLAYARSQKNNHAISEGVGLFTVGLLFPELVTSERWRQKGRRILEEQAIRQIAEDGGYIQHSPNYHRLMLHDYLWAMRLGEVNGCPFSKSLYERLARATDLLFQLIDPATGEGPNYGANDGSHVLALTGCDFTDYRPALQAASYLCRGTRLYPSGPWDETLLWLWGREALAAPLQERMPRAIRADESGYYTLRGPESWAFLRCARYRSRPSQADQLHLDVWWRGVNVACDPGTFLYGGPAPWRNGLGGTRVHNTVGVDGRDQMTRAGRFLWLNWAQGRVRAERAEGSLDYLEVEHDGYRSLGVTHRRGVVRAGDWWLVIDDILGFGTHTTWLQWLLADVPFELHEALGRIELKLATGPYAVRVWCTAPADLSLAKGGTAGDEVRGWRSRYYAAKEPAISLGLESQGALPVRFLTLLGPADAMMREIDPFHVKLEGEAACLAAVLNAPGSSPIAARVDLTLPTGSFRLVP